MHPVMRSDFLNGLLFLDRLQRDSCLHFRAEAPPLPRFHFCPVSEAATLHLIDWSEFWGALQRMPSLKSTSAMLRFATSLARKARSQAIVVSYLAHQLAT